MAFLPLAPARRPESEFPLRLLAAPVQPPSQGPARVAVSALPEQAEVPANQTENLLRTLLLQTTAALQALLQIHLRMDRLWPPQEWIASGPAALLQTPLL